MCDIRGRSRTRRVTTYCTHGVCRHWGPLQRRGKAGKSAYADSAIFTPLAAGRHDRLRRWPARFLPWRCGAACWRPRFRWPSWPWWRSSWSTSSCSCWFGSFRWRFRPPSPRRPRRPSKRSWSPWSWPSYRPQGRLRGVRRPSYRRRCGEPGPAAEPAIGNGLQMDIGFERPRRRPGYRPVRISGPSHRPGHGGQDAVDRDPAGPAADATAMICGSFGTWRFRPGPAGRTMTIPVPEVAGSDPLRGERQRRRHSAQGVVRALDVVYERGGPRRFPPSSSWERARRTPAGWPRRCPAPTIRFWATGRSRSASFVNRNYRPPRAGRWQDFSDQWINYSGFDIVCLSREQLAALGESRPAAFRALVAWTAAGGNLWVYGLGSEWQHLPELEETSRSAGDRGGPDRAGAAGLDGAGQGGSTAALPEAAETSEDDDEGNPVIYRNGRPSPRVRPSEVPAWPEDPAAKPPQRPPFVFRPLQAGLVVAWPPSSRFRGPRPSGAGSWTRWGTEPLAMVSSGTAFR